MFHVLRVNGIDPADCDLDASNQVIRLAHGPTGSQLTFVDHGGYFVYDIEVNDGPHHVGLRAGNWSELLDRLAEWAIEVAYVTETPDLWAELQQAPEILAAAQAADVGNTPFTADEQDEIAQRIDEIVDRAEVEHGLTPEQSNIIRQKAGEFKEASGRLGRKDWVMIVVGGLVSTAMTDEIPPGVVQTVLTALLHGIGHILGIGGPPPIIGA